MNRVDVIEGDGPVILGQPHGGTVVPEAIFDRLTPLGQRLADADWHIGALYDGLLPAVTVVRANVHRYVLDVNRDPTGASLYPGQNTTGLVPLTDFDGKPLWRDGQAPGEPEVAERREIYHRPYHSELARQIARLRARHDRVIVYDCHSIRSRLPFLFDGRLPVFNIGTNDATTCAPDLALAVTEGLAGQSVVRDGRFKGGWTTRHYGQPQIGVHAIQMELAQRAYLTEEAAPWTLDPGRTARLRELLADILHRLDRLARSGPPGA